MQELFQQIGALMAGAIPTAVLFIVLVLAYQFLVQKPLTETLKRRRALTEGAIEDAQKAVALAESRAAEYSEKLRHARAEAFRARENKVKQWNAQRDAALEAARKDAGHRVSEARAELEAEAAEARESISASAGALADEVVRAIMPLAVGSTR
jgi:F-type H+-transporting ATPase subunit b